MHAALRSQAEQTDDPLSRAAAPNALFSRRGIVVGLLAGAGVLQIALAAWGGQPHPIARVPSTAALQQLPTSGVREVIRDGYLVAGDAPSQRYMLNTAPCPLNRGQGDGGYQVRSRSGGCWIAQFNHNRADFREWGADPSGRSPSANAMLALAALPIPLEIRIPRGHYRLGCTTFSFASPISLSGDGALETVLKFNPGCRLGQSWLLKWNNASGVRLENLTFDVARPVVPPSVGTATAVLFYAYNADVNGLLVQGVRIVNGSSPMFLLGVAATSGHTFFDPVVRDNYFALWRAEANQNQCIGFTTNNAAGRITHALIASNICVNTGIQFDGDHSTISGNNITGFRFGTGLFMAYDTGKLGPSDYGNIVSDNLIHDSPPGLDVNRTASGGIENDCIHCVIRGNVLHHLGGAGLVNFGSYVLIEDNQAFDNGSNGPGGAGGPGDQAGFLLNVSPLGAPYNSAHVDLVNNVAYDDGRGTQLFGYYDAPATAGPVRLIGNRFSGVRAPEKVSSAPGVIIRN